MLQKRQKGKIIGRKKIMCKSPEARKLTINMNRSRAILYLIAMVLFASSTCCEGARLRRAVMMAVEGAPYPTCQSGTIVERNSSTSIILTGTVTTCDKMRPDKYSCTVKVWRIMKGEKVAKGLVTVREETSSTYFFTDIYGLGNPAFCDSEVKEDKTRIFFVNRVDDRLVLAASLLHITLQNLENTQKVIRGIHVIEPPKKQKDPCLYVLCGFGATCQSSSNGTATCVCPKVTCGSASDSSDTFAPVCGSDGVTYPSECRVKAAQCWSQHRIRIVSRRPCSTDCEGAARHTAACKNRHKSTAATRTTIAPIKETDPCETVVCGNFAKCVVVEGVAKCQCRSCTRIPTGPVCGSDQKNYRTECDMKRSACMNALNLHVVRRSTCDPCTTYNEKTKRFETQCAGACSVSEDGNVQCCDSIECDESGEVMVCGSNGRHYSSRCALERYACKTGKIIKEVSEGSCPTPRGTRVVRGTTSIAADDKCPGNCDSSSPEFLAFKKAFELDVNKNLKKKKRADIDAKSLMDFKVEEVRRGSAILVYSAVMSWNDEVIDESFVPGEDTLWAFQWLHDPANGVLKQAVTNMKVTFVAHKNPADDFLAEEVCGELQCENGAGCEVSKDAAGGFQYACACSSIGISKRLPVTLGCKIANNNRFYDNKVAAKHASCSMKTFLTFKDVCREADANPCHDVDCQEIGSICIVTNGKASCECSTCSEEFEPVCGSDGTTYKNLCQLERHNCVHKSEVTLKNKGMCASSCDEVDCGNGGQCEEWGQGAALCTCPSSCVEVYSPVCGSDGKTYENECNLTVAACKLNKPLVVTKRRPCDQPGGEVDIDDVGSGEPEGSGVGQGADECGCRFGAVCDATIDDEDARCLCNMKCGSTGKKVCGSDGKTYMNDCQLLKAQCEMQKYIRVLSHGMCSDSCSTSVYGCCEDGVTAALGSLKAGCPEVCMCNPHGSFAITCHPTTGQCVCRPGVGGLKCDQCQPGYWNFRAMARMRTVGCMDCQCNRYGSVRDDCDQMTGQCVCKEGVMGPKCSVCADGKKVKPTGCGRDVPDVTDDEASCQELQCRHGQECVLEKSTGLYGCQCPPLSSCDGYSNGKCTERKKVCASNGVTYADECQMKVVACRAGFVLTVEAEETCAKHVKTLKPVIPDLRPVSTPAVTPAQKTTVKPTEATTTTTISTTTMKSMPSTTTSADNLVSGLDTEGSGEPAGGATIDDEDRYEPSGDGDSTSTTDDSDTKRPVVPGTMSTHDTIAHLKCGEYTDELKVRDSEEFGELASCVKNKIASILSEMDAPYANISSIKNVNFHNSDIKGIKTTFVMDISDIAMDKLESFINDNLEDGESFTFSGPVPHLGESPLPDSPYVEDDDWSVPQFGGSSYIEFENMMPYSAVTINMTFKTADSEGLLLYSGRQEEGGKDFISLAVIGGYVEFRFDTGSGQLALRSAIPVDDEKWHRVVSRRNRREGVLMVDSEQDVSGTSVSGTTALNLDTSLFIGGFINSQHDRVFKHTGVRKGLTGCIKELKIGEHAEKTVILSSRNSETISTSRIAECASSPCLPNPCKHSSKCFITYQLDEFTHKCDCGSRYFGNRCEHRKLNRACAINPCHPSSTCEEDQDSYRCICPPSRTGNHCNERNADLTLPSVMEPSYMPVFAGDSYIERPPLKGVSQRLEIEIVFYTFQPDGLLFYNGQKESGEGDYVALNIRNGYLEFMYNLGGGPAVIRADTEVSLNEWHVAKLTRLERSGDLKLDGGSAKKGKSPHSHSQLNLEEPLYIGALPENVTPARSAHITTGLMGAIQKFSVNGVTLPRSLTDDDSTSYNVRAFNGHPCFRLPCQHGGKCVPDKGDFSCTCKKGFSGETCETVDESDDVPMLQDALEQAVNFNGDTHAQYNNFITRRDQSFKDNHFEFQLKTTAFHGLILYDGKPSRRGDYIALAISYGRLHLTFDLGSGPANIVSDLNVNDGLWKTVKITRNEHKAALQVGNALPQHTSAPQLTRWLNTDGLLWLGGCDAEYMPPRHRGLPKSFYVGLDGCLRQFRIDGILLHLREDVLNSPKLDTCQER